MRAKVSLIAVIFALGFGMSSAQEIKHVDTPKDVRGLYITLDTFQEDRLLNGIIELCKRTSINTLVIDVRSNGTNAFVIRNERAKQKIDQLHSMGLYLVARMIVFGNPKDGLSLHRK